MGVVNLSWKTRLLISSVWVFVKILQSLGRVKVRGLENIRNTRWENRLILPNHPSFLEPVLIPMVAFMPEMLRNPSERFPWSVANARTIRKSKFRFFREIPVIPLETNADGRPIDSVAFVKKVLPNMKHTTWIIFPEGTRSFHADEPKITSASGVVIGRARDGIGFLIARAKPLVIPVLVKGAEHAMRPDKPLWHVIIRIWRNPVEIVFGKPLDLSPLLHAKQGRDLYNEIGKEIIHAIAALDTTKEETT